MPGLKSVAIFPVAILSIVFLAGCGGSKKCVTDADCQEGGRCVLGRCEGTISCTPSCESKCCGDDGCGGTCPDECTLTSQSCDVEACVCEGSCMPYCDGRECGSDGCGGTCPPGCDEEETCTADGQCSGCQPACAGKQCGLDGCGGECGSCNDGFACSSQGRCEEVNCEEESAEVLGEFGNDVSNISFSQAQVALHHKRDVDEFEDGCITRVDIGLSYSSGCHLDIVAGERFNQGGGLQILSVQFSADSFCPGFPDSAEGIYTDSGNLTLGEVNPGVPEVPGHSVAESCLLTTLTIRLQGDLVRQSDGEILQVNETEMNIRGGFHSTGDTEDSCPCRTDCAGKECGPDGCGGTCGSCPSGQPCSNGQCQCAPECNGKVCGPDGCGGTCGSCPSGQACNNGQCQCSPQCAGKVCGPNGCGGTCGTCPAGQACDSSGTCQGSDYLEECSGTCGSGLSCIDAGEGTSHCLYSCTFPSTNCPDGGVCFPAGQAGGFCQPPGSNQEGDLCSLPHDGCVSGLTCMVFNDNRGYCAANCNCSDQSGCSSRSVQTGCLWTITGTDVCWCGYRCPSQSSTECPDFGNGWSCENYGSETELSYICVPN